MRTHSHRLWAEIQAKTQIRIPWELEALLSSCYLGKGTLRRVRQPSSSRLQQGARTRGTGAASGRKQPCYSGLCTLQPDPHFCMLSSEKNMKENLLSNERNLRKLTEIDSLSKWLRWDCPLTRHSQ